MKTYLHKPTEKRGQLVSTGNKRELAARIIAAVLDGETRPLAIAAMIEADAVDVCMDPAEDDSADPMARTIPRQTCPVSEDKLAYDMARKDEAVADQRTRRASDSAAVD